MGGGPDLEWKHVFDDVSRAGWTGYQSPRRQMMKVLGIEGPSWLRCLLNIAWKSGIVPKEWQTAIAMLLSLRKGRGPWHVCQ